MECGEKKNFLENRVSKAFRGKNVWVYLKTKINFIQKGNIHGENEWKDRVGSSHKVHHKKHGIIFNLYQISRVAITKVFQTG